MNKVLLMFVPAIHGGYSQLIERVNPAEIWLVDWNCVEEISLKKKCREYLLRSFNHRLPLDAITSSLSFLIKKSISIQTFKSLDSLLQECMSDSHSDTVVVLPEEDISQYLIDDVLIRTSMRYELSKDIFLRWSKGIPQQESIPTVTTTISKSDFFAHILKLGKEEGLKSSDQWRQVGAVLFTQEGEVITSAYNKHLPIGHHDEVFGDLRASFSPGEHPEIVSSIHAEQQVLMQLLREGKSSKGTSLFTTVYPCPVCTKLICEAGVARVYFIEGYSTMVSAWDLMQVYGIEVIQVQ